MPRTRPPYPPEFCPGAVELVRPGVPLERLAADLGVSEQTSLLRVRPLLGPLDSLWHLACAEADGVDGG